MITNIKNTLHGFKKLHGRAFDDPYIKSERFKLPYEFHKFPNGSVGVKVSFVAPNAVYLLFIVQVDKT